MAIYTMENFSMLTAKPLDAKRIMTESQWLADDDDAGLAYPGQLYYDPSNGWFRAYGKNIDDPSNHEMPVFGICIDGVYIATNKFLFYNNELDIFTNLGYNRPFIAYSNENIAYVDIDPVSFIDFSNNEFVFGTSNQITSNNNNKVISMIGTGLKTNNPSYNQFIIGKYNNNQGACFSIGNGTDNANRSNIIDVYDDSIQINGPINFSSNAPITTITIDSSDMPIKNFYLRASGDDIQAMSSPVHDYNSMPIVNNGSDNFVTGVKIKINSKYDSTAKLNIFTYTDTTTKTPTKYILQNYPIGNLNAGDLAIEELLEDVSNSSEKPYLTATITGLTDTTKGSLDLLIQYCNNW